MICVCHNKLLRINIKADFSYNLFNNLVIRENLLILSRSQIDSLNMLLCTIWIQLKKGTNSRESS